MEARNYTWSELQKAHTAGFLNGQQWSRSRDAHTGYEEAKSASWKSYLKEMEDTDAHRDRCQDCGERGKITGHMDCQYPQNH